MKIKGVQCPDCIEILYSRTENDFRSCRCGSTFVTGGYEDPIIVSATVGRRPQEIIFDLDITEEELQSDWAQGLDEWGMVSKSPTQRLSVCQPV